LPAPQITVVTPSVGPVAGNIQVSIGGVNFLTGAVVTFDNIIASVLSVTPTSILALTPIHSNGQVDVVVINPDGQRATATNAFLYSSAVPSGGGGGGSVASVVTAKFDLNRIRVLSRIQSAEPALNRLQDQIIPAVSQAISVLGQIPVAKAGVLGRQGWNVATLINGWLNLGSSQVSFCITASGDVILRGSLGGGVLGTTAFILPTGYRPGTTQGRVVPVSSNVGIITISVDGQVVPVIGTTSGTSSANPIFELDGLYFPSER
jgi:hypothetical protein